ncbi:hypothetical protein BJ138DRAFT_1174398 [Hygrophoropsis aurantiaca]|uniref:Uncharacterized protein n=1 Tax=Hygrophoropsis aurantiaca TaxID=72124 RepID=A0ACB8A437_9AGAM|nr:hypothetical protein BJ138DRAFT_1174398 [Hygrophoropsis aurantiaca]
MNRDTFTVKVDNISEHVQICEVESLFNTLVGKVMHSALRRDGSHSRSLELSFNTLDTFKKALCMSGYNIAGTPLVVTRASTTGLGFYNTAVGSDGRRNLYVLGLPFDLTKIEFAAIFSQYGTVSHAVILATVDNASRRRGFVVMSSHEEAKAAMIALSRTQIKGHMLDVSWAVVQRSQGFLDGADRTMMLNSPNISNFPEIDMSRGNTSHFARPNEQNEVSWPPTFLMASSKLLVSNLPTLLFTQATDLQPLFYPFGQIKGLKMIESISADTQNNTVAALVEYENPSSAREAKDALHGQMYGDIPVNVQYVQDSSPPADDGFASAFECSPLGFGKSADTGLNPFAPPFVLGSQHWSAPSPGFSQQPHQQANMLYNATPRGLPRDAHHPLFSPQPFSSNLRRQVSDTISRSSSATSSSWSGDAHPSGRRFRRAFT